MIDKVVMVWFIGFFVIGLIYHYAFYRPRVYGTQQQAPQGYRKSDNAITIYYTPPDVPLPVALQFFYNNFYEVDSTFETRLIGAFLCQWLFSGTVVIDDDLSGPGGMVLRRCDRGGDAGDNKESNVYIDALFGDEEVCVLAKSEKMYRAMLRLLLLIGNGVRSHDWRIGVNEYTGDDRKRLTPLGWKVYEHIRGYAHYLHSVERGVLERELQYDPDYMTKVMPRVIGFGMDSPYEQKFAGLWERRIESTQYGQGNVAVTSVFSHVKMSLQKQ